jgi:Fe-Mn family superoxide dismutase
VTGGFLLKSYPFPTDSEERIIDNQMTMFNLPDLPYDYKALEPSIDELTMHLHHDKHEATYVANFNEAVKGQPHLEILPPSSILSDLSVLSNLSPETAAKVKNNAGGIVNHEFFWSVMAPPKTPNTADLPDSLKSHMSKIWPEMSRFQDEFTRAALGRFGSGWAWLVIDKLGTLEIISTANQDSPLSVDKTPLLCLDVWEHAYYLKYQNRRADYIKAWWNIINWPKVSQNFDQVVAKTGQ